MKKFIFLFMAIVPYLVFGQKAKIEFDETSHNFGTILENAGKAIHTFKFTNTGVSPLILTNVRAGCGCTIPEWNRQPVAPGDTGVIKVSFDPRNRPGSFIKSVTVNSNSETPVLSLTIRGNVSRKPAGPYDAYRYSLGCLKLNTQNINLGNIKNTQEIDKTIEIVNTSNKVIDLDFMVTSPTLTVKASPKTLAKEEKGKIEIHYDAQKKQDWGFVSDKIEIKINDKKEGEITVVANLSEDFSSYNGNFEKAPVITLSENEITLPNLAKNSTNTHDFYIQNDGKSDLIIRKIKTSDDNISINVAKHTIKAGKKAKATVTFKTGNSNKVTKLIQFTTNDPKNSIINYKLTADLK